ncbi:MAG: L-rhamnonate dehydratase [Bryobacterales bacterium]|nr:L-rhamnonate dehydratase [Bryobacterales bacterium]
MRPSRRDLVFAAAAAAPAFAAPAEKLTITSVRAIPVNVGGLFQREAPKFTSDFDPARSRWFGPFAQLAGAITVEIKTNRGLTGYGLGGGGGAAAYVIEHHLAGLLVGANASQVELLWEQLYNSTLFYGRKGLPIMAISGIDNALWDIRGKQAGQPVHALLGGPTKDKVLAYYTGFEVEKALELGFRAFKLPIRHGLAQGREGMDAIVSQVREARKKIGPSFELMIDCLCQWDVPYTLEMADRLREFRLYFIEESLSPDNVEGYARLCREVKGPLIAHGEHEYTRYGFADLLRNRAIQVLQPDTTWCGGVTELRRIGALAAAESLRMIPHRGGSPYGLAVILTSPNCPMAESFGILERTNPVMAAMTSRFEKGYYYPSDKPGFGVELSEGMFQ